MHRKFVSDLIELQSICKQIELHELDVSSLNLADVPGCGRFFTDAGHGRSRILITLGPEHLIVSTRMNLILLSGLFSTSNEIAIFYVKEPLFEQVLELH
jgi:hypothetical protein